jgi:hypothetical protein
MKESPGGDCIALTNEKHVRYGRPAASVSIAAPEWKPAVCFAVFGAGFHGGFAGSEGVGEKDINLLFGIQPGVATLIY